LLQRIEDELLIERLWRAEMGTDCPLPHRRAAGLVAALRRLPKGAAAAAEAAADLQSEVGKPDVAALQQMVRPDNMRGLSAELLHHLAVFHARRADSAQPGSDSALEAKTLSVAAWLALAGERRYLERLGSAMLGASASAEEIDDAIESAMLAPIDHLSRRARRGGRELTAAAYAALRALAAVPSACRMSGCEMKLQKRVEAHAVKGRSAAIDEALTPISAALSEATARGRAERDGAALMKRVAEVWRWSGEDEHVERYAVDQVTPIAWNIYNEHDNWRPLRELLRPIEPLVDRLAWRIDGDPRRIAYAAPCAQMFVFRAEISTAAEEQRRHAERSLQLCPSHRNGRLILASMLCNLVRDRIDSEGLLLTARSAGELEALIDRAEQLYPQTRSIEELRRTLIEARSRLKWWS